MTPTPRRALAATAALSLAVLLGACATPVSGSSPSPTQTMGGETEVAAAWLDEGRAIAVVTWGSSTCAPIVGEPSYAAGTLTVELSDVDGRACTRDYVPRATFVMLPEGVDAAQSLDVTVTGAYSGTTALAGDAGSAPGGGGDYLPSAGWFDAEGFVLLSWGSSGCVPQLQSAEATGAAEVTATFVTPPADQVCTADMAPRLTVGAVEGVEARTGVQLVLVGDDFDNLRIPIAGSR